MLKQALSVIKTFLVALAFNSSDIPGNMKNYFIESIQKSTTEKREMEKVGPTSKTSNE